MGAYEAAGLAARGAIVNLPLSYSLAFFAMMDNPLRFHVLPQSPSRKKSMKSFYSQQTLTNGDKGGFNGPPV